jgi:hypothetical protein
MQILDAYEGFLRAIDKYQVATVRKENFLYWFHQGQQDYVDQRVNFFEQTGEIDDDLAMITSEKTYSSPSFTSGLDLPEDYFRTASLIVFFNYKNNCDDTVEDSEPIKRLTGDKKGFVLSNPYYKPNRNRWYYERLQKKLKLYGDKDVTITEIIMRYVQKLPIYTTTDLEANKDTIWSKDQQDQISKKAAMLFLENKQSQRVGTFAQVNKTDQI